MILRRYGGTEGDRHLSMVAACRLECSSFSDCEEAGSGIDVQTNFIALSRKMPVGAPVGSRKIVPPSTSSGRVPSTISRTFDETQYA